MSNRNLTAFIAVPLLVILSLWLLPYAWDQRDIYYQTEAMAEGSDDSLARFPEVLAARGLRAWEEMDPGRAADFFRQAVAVNPLLMNAWLKLAEAEAAGNNTDGARAILAFTDKWISDIFRWKWPQTLLAYDLGMDGILRRNINDFVHLDRKRSDALNLLDRYCEGSADRVLDILAPDNHEAYMAWLIQWRRRTAADTAWAALEENDNVNDGILLKYVDFLVSDKRMASAAEIWQRHTGLTGMTNGGFESEPSRKGFGWRLGDDRKDRWQLRRVFGDGRKDAYAMRVSFRGRENIRFSHLYQIVSVTPGVPYRITYWWKAKGVTTDQGPFVEIYGYDAEGLRAEGPMAAGTRGWEEVAVDFTPPDNCRAVVVRLRRDASRRFDSKIAGTLWMDDFSLTPLSTSPSG
jgi:hypothetical protein